MHHAAMNTFELVFIYEESHPEQIIRGSGVAQVYQQIWIDDVHLDVPYGINLIELTRSLFHPGEFYIFSCGCQDLDCAISWEGVFVRHEPGIIRWRFRRPFKVTGGISPHLNYEDLQQKARWVEYAFDRDQMVSDISSALCVIREQVTAEAEFPPKAIDREYLDVLNPYSLFSEIPWDARPGQSLFFLADEEAKYFLDGQFVGLDSLGLLPAFQQEFQQWLHDSSTRRIDPGQRLSWLEELRAWLLRAYREGLTENVTIRLIAQRWDNGTLDPWDQECREMDRDWLDSVSPLDMPYVCLSTTARQLQMWMDDSAEPKGYRANFIGCGAKCQAPFLVPYELEKDFCFWVASLPLAQDPERLASFHSASYDISALRSGFNWEKFNRQGMTLAARLQAVIGNRATVLYERPRLDMLYTPWRVTVKVPGI